MSEPTNHPTRILLVEDDASMLEGMHDLFFMPSLLESTGLDFDIEVMTAENGKEALAVMADHTPDLIVSDIMMPVMDGFQFLAAVHENPDWIHIPFIFLTAKGNKQEILEGQIRGANLYITKPFVSAELLELIKSQLDKSFQRQLTRKQDVMDLKKGILQILNHEFRTPLTYVTAYYEMLADSLNRVPANENFRDYLRGIQAGCIRLTKLIEDFIYVIDLRTGTFQSEFQKNAHPITNVNAIVQMAIEANEAQAAQKGIPLHFVPAAALPPVYGDEDALQNVFERLLNNAIKFTSDKAVTGKQITVSTGVQANELFVTFQDEGMGFPRHIESQIFDLFFQYNRSLLEQQGAGMGLTIAKGLVDLHNGRIQVESQEDKGSTFTVVLPIYNSENEPLPAALSRNEFEPPQATVLIVEDEHSLLIGLRELLEISEGHYRLHVLTAVNGQEGLKVLYEHQPDLIISDIMMPIMDGFEFLERVRQNANWVQIPFVFLTAKGEHQDRHIGLRSGAEVYITKPYDSDELIQLIDAQLDRYFQLQGIMSQNFDALKRSILNLITPDFRLPLSAVRMYSESLAAGLVDVKNDAELKESLHGIQEGSVRLTHLVEDFISLAEIRTEETKVAVSMREQPIYQPELIFCEASQECTIVAEAAGIQLQCDVHTKLPPVYGDSITLREGVRRLVDIGIKLCSHAGQKIALLPARNADEIHLTIALPSQLAQTALDTVLTMWTAEDFDLLSQPEFGPNMSIAKNYIKLNNGRIQFNKNSQTNQYQFVIHLPIYTPSDNAPNTT